jgi:hypothetical protein
MIVVPCDPVRSGADVWPCHGHASASKGSAYPMSGREAAIFRRGSATWPSMTWEALGTIQRRVSVADRSAELTAGRPRGQRQLPPFEESGCRQRTSSANPGRTRLLPLTVITVTGGAAYHRDVTSRRPSR